VCAQSHLALSAPSPGQRGQHWKGQRGHSPSPALLPIVLRGPRQELPAEPASLPQFTLHSPPPLPGLIQGLTKLRTFKCTNRCWVPISSLLLPFFNLCFSEQPVSLLVPLCKISLKPLSGKCKGPFFVAIHPGAMKAGPQQAVQTMSCSWSCCRQGLRQELPFGNIQPGHWPVPGQPCQAAPAHQHCPHLPAPHSAFSWPGLQASGPHSKSVERDSTAGSRHSIQCPCFPKHSNCFRSLCFFQPWSTHS